MNEFYFVIDLLDHGCIGTPYKSLEESIKAGDYQVWDKNKIRRAFNFGNGTMKDFINHCKINKEKVLTEKEFINKYEFYYNRDIEFINEEKRFCLRGFNKIPHV